MIGDALLSAAILKALDLELTARPTKSAEEKA
jgi:hypothetical protein